MGEGDGIPPDVVPAVFSAALPVLQAQIWPHITFQAEDAVAQGVHNVVEGGLVSDVEEILLVWVAGDVLDLTDEIFRVLLPAEVVPQHLRRGGSSIGWRPDPDPNAARMGVLHPSMA